MSRSRRTDADRLRAAIARREMSNTRFAEDVLMRDPRTLRDWLAGSKVPRPVRAWLDREEAEK